MDLVSTDETAWLEHETCDFGLGGTIGLDDDVSSDEDNEVFVGPVTKAEQRLIGEDCRPTQNKVEKELPRLGKDSKIASLGQRAYQEHPRAYQAKQLSSRVAVVLPSPREAPVCQIPKRAQRKRGSALPVRKQEQPNANASRSQIPALRLPDSTPRIPRPVGLRRPQPKVVLPSPDDGCCSEIHVAKATVMPLPDTGTRTPSTSRPMDNASGEGQKEIILVAKAKSPRPAPSGIMPCRTSTSGDCGKADLEESCLAEIRPVVASPPPPGTGLIMPLHCSGDNTIAADVSPAKNKENIQPNCESPNLLKFSPPKHVLASSDPFSTGTTPPSLIVLSPVLKPQQAHVNNLIEF